MIVMLMIGMGNVVGDYCYTDSCGDDDAVHGGGDNGDCDCDCDCDSGDGGLDDEDGGNAGNGDGYFDECCDDGDRYDGDANDVGERCDDVDDSYGGG